jgi:5-methylcytosine-specific restriction endonuclease McrA
VSRLPRSCLCGSLHRAGERCPMKGPELSAVRGWQALSKKILERDCYVCWLCNGIGADTVDHIKPRDRGGTDNECNLRAAHRRCNSKKGVR